jgi:hypothetical protein
MRFLLLSLVVAYFVGPVLLGLALSAFRFWQWHTIEIPAESQLVSAAGEINEVQRAGFRIAGAEAMFIYRPYWPHATDLGTELQLGKWVKVKHLPPESYSGELILSWEIEGKGRYLVRFWETSEAEKSQAKAGLLLEVLFSALTLLYLGVRFQQYSTYARTHSVK